MKKLLISILQIILISNSIAAQTPQSAIDSFLSAKGFEHALLGVCIKDMNGQTLCEFNKDKLLTPASIMKVVTTATALETLGEDFQYKTRLSYVEGDTTTLVVTGSGDPTLGSEYMPDKARNFLGRWTDKIKDQSFSRQLFRVLVDDSAFGYDGISTQWIWEDMGNYYAAGAYGISVFDNAYKICFNTVRTDTLPIITQIEPNIPDLTIQNHLTFNYSGTDNSFIHGIPFSGDRRIYGNIPANRSNFIIKGDIPDPGFLLAKTLTDNLRIEGLKVLDYQTVRGVSQKNLSLHTFYTNLSPELKEIVKQINFRSNNHYAEHLIRTIGIQQSSENKGKALDDGIKTIKSYWSLKGLDTSSLVMYDGCGLSPLDAVTPEFLTDILVDMQQGKNAASFLASLPKAGEEGTVRNFLKGTRLTGKVWAKSGSISGVQCFAGYFIQGEKKYAFVVMVNKFTGTRSNTVRHIESLLLSVF